MWPTCGATQPRAALASNGAVKNIVETAVSNEDFSTLVTLVGEAQLVDPRGQGPLHRLRAEHRGQFQKLLSAKGNEKFPETLLDKNRGLFQGILTYQRAW